MFSFPRTDSSSGTSLVSLRNVGSLMLLRKFATKHNRILSATYCMAKICDIQRFSIQIYKLGECLQAAVFVRLRLRIYDYPPQGKRFSISFYFLLHRHPHCLISYTYMYKSGNNYYPKALIRSLLVSFLWIAWVILCHCLMQSFVTSFAQNIRRISEQETLTTFLPRWAGQ